MSENTKEKTNMKTQSFKYHVKRNKIWNKKGTIEKYINPDCKTMKQCNFVRIKIDNEYTFFFIKKQDSVIFIEISEQGKRIDTLGLETWNEFMDLNYYVVSENGINNYEWVSMYLDLSVEEFEKIMFFYGFMIHTLEYKDSNQEEI
jgi:hypothetical protein